MLSGVILFAAGAFAPAPALHALIVGGGPDKDHNQVAIESNVRYVDRLLPKSAPRHVLFASGDPSEKNVQFLEGDKSIHYRAPQLPRLDGPSLLANVQQEISNLTMAAK